MKKQFKKQWGYMLCKTKIPNVYQKEKGGYVVRGRLTLLTGQTKDVTRSIDAKSPQEALRLFEAEKEDLVSPHQSKPVPCLSGYAKEHLESKILRGTIRAKSGKNKWRYRLPRILAGTVKTAEDGTVYTVQGLGDYSLTDLRPRVEDYVDQCAAMVQAGFYSPVTCNGWFDLLRTMSKAAKVTYDIPDFMAGVLDLPVTKKHKTYSIKDPNKVPVKNVPKFLGLVRQHWPQHYAMIVLGTITGIRPSTLRPIRRVGPFDDDGPDIDWETGSIQVRRSMTGGEIMDTTKTGIEYPIPLPPGVLDDLSWHISRLSDVQLTSDLLFPNEEGGFRCDSCLRKCFEDLSERMALGYDITPRAMRRTFNDIARRAGVSDLVTRSISGHQTKAMAEWYSTLEEDERLKAVTEIYTLALVKEAA